MENKLLSTTLIMLTSLLISCSLSGGSMDKKPLEDQFPEEISETYTAELLSEGFDFCPDSYLIVEIEQSHEIAKFNYSNYVNVIGELPLEPFGVNEKSGLKTEGDIELVGEGWVGICKFQSSGSLSFQLQARLIPGETYIPNLLIAGQSKSEMSTKPPCGDFGMMPLEKAVHLIIPYRDGGTTEWEWENQAAGVSGNAIWTLRIPCK